MVDTIVVIVFMVMVSLGLTSLMLWMMYEAVFNKVLDAQDRHAQQMTQMLSEAFAHLASRNAREAAEAVAIKEQAVVQRDMMKVELQNLIHNKAPAQHPLTGQPNKKLELITPDNIDEILGSSEIEQYLDMASRDQ